MRRLLTVFAALALSTTACLMPSTRNAESVLQRTTANLGKISSGTLFLRLETALADRKPGGFELEGPFSLESDGDLPVVEFRHTRFDGERVERSATFVSTGTAAYIVRGDESTRVPADELAEAGLGELVRRDDDDRGLGELNIEDWIVGDPDVSAGGLVGRVDTDKVTAKLDAGELMDGLIALSRSLGGGGAGDLQTLPDVERERVRRAVKKAELQAWSGKDDRLLRKLLMEVEFEVRNEDLREQLKQLAGARIKLEASITDVNEPVEVEAPR